MYKIILLMLSFSTIGYSSSVFSSEIDYLTNRVAQSLYAGGNIKKTEILDICDEIKSLQSNLVSNTGSDLESYSKDDYNSVLFPILESKSNIPNWEKSKDKFLEILIDLKKEVAPTIVDNAFISIVEKLSS